MKFTDYIEDIDFDGAEIESISRVGKDVSVIFNNCILFTRHPKSSEFRGKINGLSITFFGVTNESAIKFIGVGEFEPYGGEKPMEYIEVLSVSANYYEYGGYVDGEPWYQWSFYAERYEGGFSGSM